MFGLIEFGDQRLSLSKLNLRGIDDKTVRAHIRRNPHALAASLFKLLADDTRDFLSITILQRDDLDHPITRDGLIDARQQIADQSQVSFVGGHDERVGGFAGCDCCGRRRSSSLRVLPAPDANQAHDDAREPLLCLVAHRDDHRADPLVGPRFERLGQVLGHVLDALEIVTVAAP